MLSNVKTFSATNIIIFITIIGYFIQNSIEHGAIIMGLNSLFLTYGFYWQPLTTMFTHGGLFHIAMNMFVLFQFGNLVEQAFGVKKFLIIYFVGGILTSLFSFLYMYGFDSMSNLVGASGAISVIIGLIALKDQYQRKGMIIWILLISFAPLLIGLPVAWYAHLIGFGIGWILGYFI
ncbi:MAG: rhomboid family intramembrane serine protease [Campylobacterales bacterium]|nr:rhomboid family intramembrane serine protease [Campylobacterales bacterium]